MSSVNTPSEFQPLPLHRKDRQAIPCDAVESTDMEIIGSFSGSAELWDEIVEAAYQNRDRQPFRLETE